MLVRELMREQAVCVQPTDSVARAARLLYRNNVGALPVCAADGRLRGVVTDRDIVLRCVAAEINPAETLVREVMSRNLVTVSPDEDVREACRPDGRGAGAPAARRRAGEAGRDPVAADLARSPQLFDGDCPRAERNLHQRAPPVASGKRKGLQAGVQLNGLDPAARPLLQETRAGARPPPAASERSP